MNSIPQLNARTFALVDLVDEVWRGRVRIPDFQRPLRWQWEDVRRLFDSILKGYPIGNLLLWRRFVPAAHVTLGALEFDAPEIGEGWWVVDGQQRLISLANALDDRGAHDDRFALSYDLRNKEFSRSQRDDPWTVPLPVIFDLRRLLEWFSSNPEVKDKLDDAARVTKAIREFPVPAYIVEQQDEDVLRDIFDRMNNYGKRLSRAEIFSALHSAGQQSSEAESPFDQIAETIDVEHQFGRLDDDTVLRAVLARRGGDVTREIRLEFSAASQQGRDFGDESPQVAYREGERAISRAVNFLQEEVGVPHFVLLPYRYLLVVLARLFAHFPEPEPRNRELLRRWFWRAAITGPGVFSGSWTYAMRSLATRIQAGDESGSVQRLLDPPILHTVSPPKLTQFRTSAAETRIVLCALWALGPRSFVTGAQYGRKDLYEAVGVDGTLARVVDRIIRREPDGRRAWAANRVFVLDDKPRESVSELLTSPRVELAGQTFRRVLESQALTDDLVTLLAQNDVARFLDLRQQAIAGVVNNFITTRAGVEFEDTPPLDALDLDDDDEEGLDSADARG